MNGYTVYMHVFPNGKKYIGITMNDVRRRWMGGHGYSKCPKMKLAIERYGWENIEHVILFTGLSKAEAERKEIELIAWLDTIRNGYNIDHGGNTIGTHSDETKRKISAGNKGKNLGKKQPPEFKERLSRQNSGEGNPFFGKHHTAEVKTKQSRFMMGNSYNKGNHHTDEFKAWKSKQMSEKYANGGNPRCREVLMTSPEGAETAFYSLRAAAENAAVSPSTMHKLIKTGAARNGFKWRFSDEK